MLKDSLQADVKAALRARETQRLSAIRMLIAAVKQREIDDQITLDEGQLALVRQSFQVSLAVPS